MKPIHVIVLSFVAFVLLSCASPQDRAYEAQEQVHKERLKLIDEYQECRNKAGDDKLKTEACDQYLKAAEALK
jgi:outer membrane biogenesis lipoprotein LolB